MGQTICCLLAEPLALIHPVSSSVLNGLLRPRAVAAEFTDIHQTQSSQLVLASLSPRVLNGYSVDAECHSV